MSAYTPHIPLWKRFLSLPKTGLGWWSVGMTATSLVLLIFGVLVFEALVVEAACEGVIGTQAITMFLCGLAGGVLGLIAVVRRHERSAQLPPSPLSCSTCFTYSTPLGTAHEATTERKMRTDARGRTGCRHGPWRASTRDLLGTPTFGHAYQQEDPGPLLTASVDA